MCLLAMAIPKALATPDVLLLVLSHVDTTALCSLRLVNSRINSVILIHQKSICSNIGLREHAIQLDWPIPQTEHISKISYLKALIRIPKARRLAQRAISSGIWIVYMRLSDDFPRTDTIHLRCIRGILIMWALVDIQRSVSPSKPIPKYVKTPWPKPPKTRSKIAKLLGVQKSRPTLQPIYDAQNVPVRLIPEIAYASLPESRSLAGIQKRYDIIRAAQEPFVAKLDHDARVDLEVAIGQLHWIRPFETGGCFGGASLEHKRKCWWKEAWMVRQGPEFLLATGSKDEMERAWTYQVMEAEWNARVVEAEALESRRDQFQYYDPMKSGKSLSSEAWDVQKAATQEYQKRVF